MRRSVRHGGKDRDGPWQRQLVARVIALAVDQLDGRYAAAVRLYETYIDHILDMADMLSTGIIQQFPNRF